MNPSDYTLFYNSATLTAFTADQLWALFGIDIQTISIEVLNYQGFYPVVETPITADTGLYTATPVYTVVGDIADQTWIYTARPLPTAQNYATAEVKNTANQQVSDIVAISGYSAEVLAAAGAALEGARPAVYQTVIAAEQVVTDQLALDVAAIAAATTVDEINNIVNPPTGILSTGRGGDGDGPLDLNNSFYTEFNSVSMTEAETELYVPGTSTVITYGAVVPNGFTSNGDCFVLGDYQVQIREVATGMVISEFECPLAVAANVDVPF
jgi:hypothetical protein